MPSNSIVRLSFYCYHRMLHSDLWVEQMWIVVGRVMAILSCVRYAWNKLYMYQASHERLYCTDLVSAELQNPLLCFYATFQAQRLLYICCVFLFDCNTPPRQALKTIYRAQKYLIAFKHCHETRCNKTTYVCMFLCAP